MNKGVQFAIALLAVFTASTMFANVIMQMAGKNAAMAFMGIVFLVLGFAVAGYDS